MYKKEVLFQCHSFYTDLVVSRNPSGLTYGRGLARPGASPSVWLHCADCGH